MVLIFVDKIFEDFTGEPIRMFEEYFVVGKKKKHFTVAIVSSFNMWGTRKTHLLSILTQLFDEYAEKYIEIWRAAEKIDQFFYGIFWRLIA